MRKGIVGGLHNETGCIMSEGNTYNFNIKIVNGTVANGHQVDFELNQYDGVVKVDGLGATKPTPAPQPKQKPKHKQKENTASKLVDNFAVDNRELLTEDK